MTGSQYLKLLNPLALFNTGRTRDIFKVNPTVTPERKEADHIVVSVFDYDKKEIKESSFDKIESCEQFKDNGRISWINVDGIRKREVELLCNHFGIHYLIAEDILSVGQRPKIDEIHPGPFAYQRGVTGVIPPEKFTTSIMLYYA